MQIPFFLFPGLACTQRLFSPQREGLSDICRVIVPDWVEPLPKEDLRTFARRWGESVFVKYFSQNDNHPKAFNPSDGCFVGGLSFGGMCAPYIGEFLEEHGIKVLACFNLATIQGGSQIPTISRLLWQSINMLPFGGWKFLQLLCFVSLKLRGKHYSMPRRETYLQLLESPARRCHRVLQMISHWRDIPQNYTFPQIHIHGKHDVLLPLSKLDQTDIFILNAGHLLTLTHIDEVNDILRTEIVKFIS